MKNFKIFSLAIMCISLCYLVPNKANAQSDYVMFLGIYLDPGPGKAVELVNGVKEHNKKFHAEGENKAYLWNVLTGPRSGQFSWAQGPMKYGKMDESLTTEHSIDWEANVSANCKNISDFRFFRRLDDHSYNPENETVGNSVVARIFYGVSDQAAALETINMIKEVLVAKKHDYARRVYVSDFRTKEGEDIMLIYPFDSWTQMETRIGLSANFTEEFNSTHGEGSWAKALEVLNASTEGWYDEVRVMVE